MDSQALTLRDTGQQQEGCSHVQQLGALVERDRLLVQLRADQELHHHKQIWAKDAHGGPYRKLATGLFKARLPKLEAVQLLKTAANETAGASSKVVRKEPDDCARRSLVLAGPAAPRPEDLLGYEQVDIGPTTNFVGNHMTRGAVDLVQAELSGMMDRPRAGSKACALPPRERHADSAAGRADATSDDGSGVCSSSMERDQLPWSAVPIDIASLRLLARQLLRVRDGHGCISGKP